MSIERRDGEGMTEFTLRRIRAEIIEAELEELASNFEGAGGMWHGASIATALRERIKNHPAIASAVGGSSRQGERS